MSNKEYLSNINSPDELKILSQEQLENLCAEIRQKIIDVVSKNGGHLASNLGVVELTVALHKVFDCPKDDILWDVGHQCYTHKMLTGRFKQIDSIRMQDGISGFPKRSESEYDPLSVGHSSTSISSALGIARAKALNNQNSHTIAVIGDGALSGGLAYEGLNNAGDFKKNFIVILNDNKMSISRNVGSISKYLCAMRTRAAYFKVKNTVDNMLRYIPVLGKPVKGVLLKSKSALKKFIYSGTLFENMGFRYYGPVEGHDIKHLIEILEIAKKTEHPVLVHVSTQKGKGYAFAEKDPKNFHGTPSFDIKTGDRKNSKDDFSSVFGQHICDLARKDERICAITAAMKLGTGLAEFAKEFKNRFFDVGIAEGHAVTFAGGLAVEKKIPFFVVYSTFLQRAYDQIIHDAALQNLKIVLAIDRAGIVGEDGETHQGVFDVSFLNAISNMTIYSPSFFEELKFMMNVAAFEGSGVMAIRYPRGSEVFKPKDYVFMGQHFSLYGHKPGNKIAILTYGRLFSYACLAKEDLEKKGVSVSIIKLNRIKPIEDGVFEEAQKFENLFFFEEALQIGGIGEHFGFELLKRRFKGKFILQAIKNSFIPQAKLEFILKDLLLDDAGMQRIILNEIEAQNEKTT